MLRPIPEATWILPRLVKLPAMVRPPPPSVITSRRPSAAFVNVPDVNQAHEMLEALPLGQAHLMTFSLFPLGPLKPLSKLLSPSDGQ